MTPASATPASNASLLLACAAEVLETPSEDDGCADEGGANALEPPAPLLEAAARDDVAPMLDEDTTNIEVAPALLDAAGRDDAPPAPEDEALASVPPVVVTQPEMQRTASNDEKSDVIGAPEPTDHAGARRPAQESLVRAYPIRGAQPGYRPPYTPGMLATLLLPLLALAEPTDGVARKPTLAVFTLIPAEGISEGVARLLSESLTQHMRNADAFSRIISASEIEAIVGFERTRQLANCDGSSCAAEMANALGVDLICVGNIGRIGKSVLMNLKLLAVSRAGIVASVAERLPGGNEEALLDQLPHATRALLSQAGLGRAGVETAVVPILPASAPPAQAAPPPESTTPAPNHPEHGSWSVPSLAGGGLALGAAALAAPATLALAAVTFFVGGAGAFLVLNNVAGMSPAQANVPANIAGGVAAGVSVALGLSLTLACLAGGAALVVLARP